MKIGGDVAFLCVAVPLFLLPDYITVRDEMFLPRVFVLPISVVFYYTAWEQGFVAGVASAPGLCDLGRYAWGVYILQEPFMYGLCAIIDGDWSLDTLDQDAESSLRDANNLVAAYLALNLVAGLCLKFEVPFYKYSKVKIESKLFGRASSSKGPQERDDNNGNDNDDVDISPAGDDHDGDDHPHHHHHHQDKDTLTDDTDEEQKDYVDDEEGVNQSQSQSQPSQEQEQESPKNYDGGDIESGQDL